MIWSTTNNSVFFENTIRTLLLPLKISQELNKYQGNLISIFIRGPLDLLLYYIILYLATTKNTFQTYSQGCLWFWLLLHGQICLFEAMLFFKVSVNDVYIFEKMKLVGYSNIKHNVPWHHSRSKKFLWNNIDSWRSFLHNLSVHW